MPVYLGIDYGLERMGVAVSDPDGRIAFPVGTFALANYPGRAAQLDALAACARERGAAGIIMGLPLLVDGTETIACRQARNVAARLRRRCALPVHFMPEELSTCQALDDLKEAGVKKGRMKGVIDQQAACRILQSWLDNTQTRGSP